MKNPRLWLCATSILSVQALAGAAWSQEAAQQVSEVIVTGSRIARATTFSTPTPVTAQTSDELAAAAPSTLAAGLQTLPSVSVGGGPTAGGGTANGGQNFLSLRGLGSNRTLTLVDGRRFTPSNNAGGVDSNLIPSGVVERVDVVTGGASAAYGSDAVAGVINFVLLKSFRGLKVDSHYGISEHGDNKEIKTAVTYGANFLDDRGHLLVGAEYFKNDGVRGDAREFRRHASNIIPNPAGGPTNIVASDVRTPYTRGGLIVIGAGGSAASNALFQGIKFDQGGARSAYNYGTVASDRGLNSGFQSGGDGFQVSTGQEIVRPLKRSTLFTRTSFDITPDINAFVEASYGATESFLDNSPTTHTLTIQRDNAFLGQVAPDLVAQMVAAGVPRLMLNRLTLEENRRTKTLNMNNTVRVLAGIEGELGGWHWELTAQQGVNRNKSHVVNNLITARMGFAADAVINPVNGQVVCRATLPGSSFNAAAAGCAPFNPFGEGAPSAASLKYVFGELTSLGRTEMKGVEASVSGELFQLPAGAVAIAIGGEMRNDESKLAVDPLSQAGAYRLVNSQAFYGRSNTKEGFVEADIPVLKDVFLAKDLSLNLAARHTEYSFSGGVNTWKAGVNWALTRELRLRYTRSRDIRAPNLTELYATGRQNNITIDDTLYTGRTYLSVPNKTFGNPDLTPEIADTNVMGFVYRPEWLPGFNMAVDYYAIRIKDAIGNVGGNNAVQQCNLAGQNSPICAFVIRDASKAVIGTRTSPFNLTVQKIDGVDIEVGYKMQLADFGWATSLLGDDPGSLNLRMVAGYLSELVTISPLVPITINDAGADGIPKWRATLAATYEKGPWQVRLQGRYIGDWVWNRTFIEGVTTNFNHVADRAYLDGQVSYEFSKRAEVYVNVQNLLDRDPAFAPDPTGATPLSTDTGLYDQVGRSWRVGVRLRF
ncbi:TonB-dependent receptor domain-containing protein [Caulobacter sp.]|uniref:TonB-dependent receptor domain-containing protein n=1 Tax=Caulobacter sp. TaxID=78 RepID=UPI002B45C4BF|nr:TonB-dependent receptor [Caulobacter sp.]HJV41498.1 TonB-dependent receptor [Caulobacter sp.]